MTKIRTSLARFAASGFGPDDARRSLDICRNAWRHHGILLIRIDDPDFTWDQRAMIEQIGDRRYGRRETTGPPPRRP